MSDRKQINARAITIKEISGKCIQTIPVGTPFTITWFSDEIGGYSICNDLGITSIYNDEFKLLN